MEPIEYLQYNYLHWDTNPVLLSIGFFQLRWYSLFFSLAFLCGYLIIGKIYEFENKNTEDLDNLLFYVFVGTLVGARLGHCLFYEPEYYLSNPLEILKFWKGGLASHGAAVGDLIALYLYLKRNAEISYLWLFDRILIPAALGAACIRLGNFFNSEILGIPAPQYPWAVIFERIDSTTPRHPTQLYESTCYFMVFFILLVTYIKYKKDIAPGLLAGLFFTLIFSSRFMLEFTKTAQASFEQSIPISVGQILSIPLILLGCYFLRKAKKTMHNKYE